MIKTMLRNAMALLLAAAMLLPAPAFARDEMQNTDPDKYYIEVDTGNQVVTVFQKDDDGEYTRIVRRFVCTTGKTRDTETEPASPTPSGKWKMGARERFGKFANFEGEYSRYWTQIVGGIYFHSIMFGKRDVNELKKSPFRNLGKDASHGCIRLYVEDAKWLYDNACFGTTVNVVSRSRKKDLASSLKTDMDFDEYVEFQANIYDEEPLEDRTAWISVDRAELRTGNGTNDKLIKKLKKDTEVKVLQEGDPWVKVVADEREGYVRRCYITYEKGVMQSVEDGYFVAGTQYLYAEPNTKAEKLYKVARHSTIVITEENVDEDGKWVKVNYWGTEGYMLRKNIKTGWATIYEEEEGQA
ncbi:MAG: SH3 domain-containing protein [Clostridia bacterium]|nr:SH3 domain-containing protein [Clostridia bacterium]